jgi:hypothetical protein
MKHLLPIRTLTVNRSWKGLPMLQKCLGFDTLQRYRNVSDDKEKQYVGLSCMAKIWINNARGEKHTYYGIGDSTMNMASRDSTLNAYQDIVSWSNEDASNNQDIGSWKVFSVADVRPMFPKCFCLRRNG